jgi:hypothetical protein
MTQCGDGYQYKGIPVSVSRLSSTDGGDVMRFRGTHDQLSK